ncbi:hypothetical protein [Streptomyces sp. MNP-20]|uniref:hypothetical protein n=1 Tax=Streptomyces sp. MNP-20 TaxID=2721165 RepID=UPI001C1E4EE0|nr:hypothetical protein [Streptomyces sp. MNP-20]
MDGPTLWVLAVFGLISIVCVMGTRVASEVEELVAAWSDVVERLRRRRDESQDDDEEDHDDEEGQGGGEGT